MPFLPSTELKARSKPSAQQLSDFVSNVSDDKQLQQSIRPDPWNSMGASRRTSTQWANNYQASNYRESSHPNNAQNLSTCLQEWIQNWAKKVQGTPGEQQEWDLSWHSYCWSDLSNMYHFGCRHKAEDDQKTNKTKKSPEDRKSEGKVPAASIAHRPRPASFSGPVNTDQHTSSNSKTKHLKPSPSGLFQPSSHLLSADNATLPSTRRKSFSNSQNNSPHTSRDYYHLGTFDRTTPGSRQYAKSEIGGYTYGDQLAVSEGFQEYISIETVVDSDWDL